MRYIFLVSGAKIKKRRANYGHTFIINVFFIIYRIFSSSFRKASIAFGVRTFSLMNCK